MKTLITQIGQILFVCLLLSLCSLRSFSKSTITSGNAAFTFEVSDEGSVVVNIQWDKAFEVANSDMEIERSFDQVEYKTVALVFAPDADYTGLSNYTFKDKSKELAGKPRAWYRIRQIDSKGNVTYTDVKLVELISSPKAEIKLFPNPFAEKISVEFNHEGGGAGKVRLVNMNGEEVSSKALTINNGSNAVDLVNLKSIPNGIYVVEVSFEGVIQEKIKVMKN